MRAFHRLVQRGWGSALWLLVLLILTACGGDGNHDTTPNSPTGPTVTASTTYSPGLTSAWRSA